MIERYCRINCVLITLFSPLAVYLTGSLILFLTLDSAKRDAIAVGKTKPYVVLVCVLLIIWYIAQMPDAHIT